MLRTGLHILLVLALACSHIEFRRSEESRVVVDDIFLAVVAVGAIATHALLRGQVFVGLLRAFEILSRSVVTLGRNVHPFEMRHAGKACNRHATAFTECRLVIGTLYAVGTLERAEFAPVHRVTPLVENRHVEESLVVEHAQQEVRTERRLVRSLRLGARTAEQLRNVFCRKSERPHRQRNLLRVQVVRIGKVRKVLAHVAAGIVPAAVDIARGTAPVYRDLLVLFDNRLVCRTVVVEVVHHHRERLLRESLVADKELLRARRATRGHFHMEVTRLCRLFRQADGIILAVVRPVVRILARTESARRHGSAGHAAIRVEPEGPLLPFEVVGAADHD